MALNNRDRKKYLGILAGILLPLCLSAQMEFPGRPLVLKTDQKSAGIPYYMLPDAGSLSKRLGKKLEKGLYKDDIFASTVQVDITPSLSDSWKKDDQGLFYWRMGFSSENASSLGLTFSPYQLEPGTKIFVYTPDGRKTLGAFTFRNNKKSGLLALSSLPGDSLIVEIQSIHEPRVLGDLKIATLSIGFPGRDRPREEKDGYYGWSAACEVDVNCLDISRYQMQKLSVCRLVIEDGAIRKRCTGTLMNNTAEDGKPYILTARHCVSNDLAANQTVFAFDYESPYCDGPDKEMKSISGSRIVSMGDGLDFVLLEMYEKPPVDYTPVYAGWNAGSEPPLGSYIIHHPEGDVKKVSYDVDEASVTSFGVYERETFWQIENYEEGSTENGSSGGALFNSYNQVVGTLTGGGTVCTDPINDCYQQLYAVWTPSEDSLKQLKHWLDPENSGQTALNNLDLYGAFTTNLSNISDQTNLDLPLMNAGWGYASGHNSLGSVEFAEYLPHAGTKYVYGFNLQVAKAWFQPESNAKMGSAALSALNPTLRLKIWEGTEYPETLLFSKDIFPFELVEDADNYIRLDTLIQVNDGFFAGYEIFYNAVPDTFALYTGTPATESQENYAMMNTGSGWGLLNDGEQNLHVALALSTSVLDYYPQPGIGTGEFPEDDVTVYPNPALDYLQVLFKDPPTEDVSITVYDLYGNLIYYRTYSPTPTNIHFNLNSIVSKGIYLLRVEYGENVVTKKFVKL